MSTPKSSEKKRKDRSNEQNDVEKLDVLANEKEGKKKMRKRARKEAAEVDQAEMTANKADQCREYLEKWAESVQPQADANVWKFNKQIQNWLIRNVFARKVVTKDIFKLALPYIGSIKGASASRLLESASKIADVEEEVHDEQIRRLEKKEGSESKVRDLKTTRKRAMAIVKVLS